MIFSMPRPGNPPANIQNDGSKAKWYQVRQVIEAIDKKRQMDATAAKKRTEESKRK